VRKTCIFFTFLLFIDRLLGDITLSLISEYCRFKRIILLYSLSASFWFKREPYHKEMRSLFAPKISK